MRATIVEMAPEVKGWNCGYHTILMVPTNTNFHFICNAFGPYCLSKIILIGEELTFSWSLCLAL